MPAFSFASHSQAAMACSPPVSTPAHVPAHSHTMPPEFKKGGAAVSISEKPEKDLPSRHTNGKAIAVFLRHTGGGLLLPALL